MGFNSALRGSECENRRVDIWWRWLLFRSPVSATENVDSEDRKNAADLLEKHLSIGLLGLREFPGLRCLGVVWKRAALGGVGDFNKPGLKVAPVSFIEGIVTTADEDCSVPPVFLTVVLTESSREVFSSADITGDALDRTRVVTKKKIDAVSVSLFAGKETSKGCAGPDKDMAGPSRDVRGCDTARLPVNEEELDVFSAHGVISSQGR